MWSFEENKEYEEQKCEAFYEKEMENYVDEGSEAFIKIVVGRNYFKMAVCIAEQFIEENWAAIEIFKDLGLTAIHAYALTGNKKKFIDEMDEILEHAYVQSRRN